MLILSTSAHPCWLARNSSYCERGAGTVPARRAVPEEGSRGDSITVESPLDRKSFLSRVTGIDQVEVSADASTTSKRCHRRPMQPTLPANPPPKRGRLKRSRLAPRKPLSPTTWEIASDAVHHETLELLVVGCCRFLVLATDRPRAGLQSIQPRHSDSTKPTVDTGQLLLDISEG